MSIENLIQQHQKEEMGLQIQIAMLEQQLRPLKLRRRDVQMVQKTLQAVQQDAATTPAQPMPTAHMAPPAE